MKNVFISVAVLVLAVGCGSKKEPLPTAPDPNIIRFEQIERKLFEVENEYNRGLDDLEQKISASTAKDTENESDIEKRMMLQEQKNEALTDRIQKLEEKVSALAQQNRETQQVERTPRAEHAVISISSPQSRLFPIGVYGVSGQKVVTGSHLASRQVETGETYRNEFGKRVPRTRTELAEVNEYGYQVRFSAQNMTDKTLKMVISAGAKEREITLPPQGIVKNASVDSAVGADLVVVTDGLTKRYPVRYP